MQKSLTADAPSETRLTEGLASRYEALIRIAELIRSHPGEKDLFQTLASDLHGVVPFDGVSQFDSAANRVQWHFLEPYNKEFESRAVRAIPKEETVAWWVYVNQRPVVIPFIDREVSFPLVVERLSKLGLRSLCALPLSTAHRQLGSLVFASQIENAYSAEDQRFLSVAANQIAVAMDDARAQARLRLLLDITHRIVTKLELRDLLREIVGSIKDLMQYESVGVALPDCDDGELRRYVVDSPGQAELKPEQVADLAKTVFRTGRPINATKEELAADPRVPTARNSLCLYPLISRDRVLGVFGVGSSSENAFIEDDLTFLGEVANQIALAVENAVAYGQISDLKDKLAQENVYLESDIRSELHFEDIV
jgi:formate hydrogenlyase transcriptional activator